MGLFLLSTVPHPKYWRWMSNHPGHLPLGPGYMMGGAPENTGSCIPGTGIHARFGADWALSRI